MPSTIGLTRNAPSLAWNRLALRVGDLGFKYRVARVRRLRRAGRHAEVDRTLLAMQRYILARCRRWPAGR